MSFTYIFNIFFDKIPTFYT